MKKNANQLALAKNMKAWRVASDILCVFFLRGYFKGEVGSNLPKNIDIWSPGDGLDYFARFVYVFFVLIWEMMFIWILSRRQAVFQKGPQQYEMGSFGRVIQSGDSSRVFDHKK